MDSKEKILIVPSYIASLKHYEKLVPYLEERGFEIEYFLFGKSSMSEYCEEKGLKHHILINDQMFQDVGLKNIPIFTPIKKRGELSKKLREFFNNYKPNLIISAFAYNQSRMQALFSIAKEQKIRVIVLQWALGPKENVTKHRFLRQIFKPKDYPFLFKNGAYRIHRWIVKLITKILDTLSIGPGYNYPNFTAEKYLLITEGDKEARLLMGYPEEKLKVVGSLDVEFVRNLYQEIEASPTKKESLFQKYDLNSQKKNILLISTTFHLEATTKFTDNAGQILYFENVIQTIQKIFPKEKATIIFKIHPREQDIYSEKYQPYGVKVFGRESSVEELVILSDLYLAHPLTSVNFSASGVYKDSIFFNFSPYDFLDETGRNFGIKEIAKTETELENKLQQYKEGKLAKQYQDIFPKGAIENILSSIFDLKEKI